MAIRNGVRLFDFEQSLPIIKAEAFKALVMVQISILTYSLNLFLNNFDSKLRGHRLFGLFLFVIIIVGILVAAYGESLMEMTFMQVLPQIQFGMGFLFILLVNQEIHDEHLNSLFEIMHGQ